MKLAEKVAQLFLVGSDSQDPMAELDPFRRVGLGGFLLFRHHLQPFADAMDVQSWLKELQQSFGGAGLSFVGIDQEGGQVERLPHWYFPTGVQPVVLGMQEDTLLCEQINRETARRLRWLGVNLNFTPTVDLAREALNPIIGARAYGARVDPVVSFARVVVQAHLEAGVLPVAKHFPGHGSGTVDSHLALPRFENWHPQELDPYRHLIAAGLPAVMVAHGLYPELFRQWGADPEKPASLSQAMIQQLLRAEMHFKGLVFSDDLTMKAIDPEADPGEIALEALQAGIDMLVYRRAQPEAANAFETLVNRVRQGKLSENLIEEKLQRILDHRRSLQAQAIYPFDPQAFSEEACHTLSLHWAERSLIMLQDQFPSPLPFSHRTRWALAEPDRSTMVHYQGDLARGHGLLACCQSYGLFPAAHLPYDVFSPEICPVETPLDPSMEALVFLAWNSHLHPQQQQAYRRLKQRYPAAKIILVSTGYPVDHEFLPGAWTHVVLPSLRPAGYHALVHWLINTPTLRHSDMKTFNIGG